MSATEYNRLIDTLTAMGYIVPESDRLWLVEMPDCHAALDEWEAMHPETDVPSLWELNR